MARGSVIVVQIDVDVWLRERIISKFNQVAVFTWRILYFIVFILFFVCLLELECHQYDQKLECTCGGECLT